MDPTTLLVLSLGGIAIAIVLALVAVGSLTAERAGVTRSLAAIDALDAADADLRARELERPFGERVITPSYTRLSNLGRALTPANQSDRLVRRLDAAGNPPGWDVDRVLAWKFISLVGGPVVAYLLALLLGLSATWIIVLVVLGALVGFYLPDVILYQAGVNRSEQIRRDLPDAIDLLTISVEAGLAFDAAMSQVARNTKGPVAEEFFRVLSEMQIGRSRSDAFRAMGERNDVPELRAFTTAMVQADAFGIPISDVLRVQSQEMRIKRRQYAEERAQKVPIKIIFPLVLFILPAIFVVMIGPAILTIRDTLSGGLGG
jgi:tight adherence protein C